MIIGGFVLLLKQYKEIKNIMTVLNAKQEEGKSSTGNSIPIKLDLGALNNLIASGIAKIQIHPIPIKNPKKISNCSITQKV